MGESAKSAEGSGFLDDLDFDLVDLDFDFSALDIHLGELDWELDLSGFDWSELDGLLDFPGVCPRCGWSATDANESQRADRENKENPH